MVWSLRKRSTIWQSLNALQFSLLNSFQIIMFKNSSLLINVPSVHPMLHCISYCFSEIWKQNWMFIIAEFLNFTEKKITVYMWDDAMAVIMIIHISQVIYFYSFIISQVISVFIVGNWKCRQEVKNHFKITLYTIL